MDDHGSVAVMGAVLERGADPTPELDDAVAVGAAVQRPLGVVELQHHPLLPRPCLQHPIT